MELQRAIDISDTPEMSLQNTLRLYSKKIISIEVIIVIRKMSIYIIHQIKMQHRRDISPTNDHQAVMEKLHCSNYADKFTLATQREIVPLVVFI